MLEGLFWPGFVAYFAFYYGYLGFTMWKESTKRQKKMDTPYTPKTSGKEYPVYKWAEIRKHVNADDAWIVIDDKVAAMH